MGVCAIFRYWLNILLSRGAWSIRKLVHSEQVALINMHG